MSNTSLFTLNWTVRIDFRVYFSCCFFNWLIWLLRDTFFSKYPILFPRRPPTTLSTFSPLTDCGRWPRTSCSCWTWACRWVGWRWTRPRWPWGRCWANCSPLTPSTSSPSPRPCASGRERWGFPLHVQQRGEGVGGGGGCTYSVTMVPIFENWIPSFPRKAVYRYYQLTALPKKCSFSVIHRGHPFVCPLWLKRADGRGHACSWLLCNKIDRYLWYLIMSHTDTMQIKSPPVSAVLIRDSQLKFSRSWTVVGSLYWTEYLSPLCI